MIHSTSAGGRKTDRRHDVGKLANVSVVQGLKVLIPLPPTTGETVSGDVSHPHEPSKLHPESEKVPGKCWSVWEARVAHLLEALPMRWRLG